ncbi:hypothetical protein K1T71_003411 [Dendrolimus kikuchii]|uniref:Uncharacterized protein n=1 Tax=Dendrolimus kikuchii TaxID=765133 RepID=A0ACC1DC00_9NEOP|nr:hypothetical protein K1T71_003411 [Dendrolimus kikuchii]
MTTRSQKKATDQVKSGSILTKRVEKSWILLVKESLLENNSFSIITLPHPAHKKPSKYCLDEVNYKIYEVVTFSEPYRSWFIGETVKSDGSIQMLTPINPLFLVLPRLKEHCSNKAMPLEDLLSEKGFTRIHDFISNLDKIGDLKGPSDMKAYKYNEEKALVWLEERVKNLAKVLREKNIHVTSGAVSATFVTSAINNDSVNEEFYLKYAHGIISEYLQDDIVEALEKRFNFRPDLIETVGKKRKSAAIENGFNGETNKKLKSVPGEEISEDLVKQNVNDLKKPKALSTKEKARQKAASGTKTISAFFKKK